MHGLLIAAAFIGAFLPASLALPSESLVYASPLLNKRSRAASSSPLVRRQAAQCYHGTPTFARLASRLTLGQTMTAASSSSTARASAWPAPARPSATPAGARSASSASPTSSAVRRRSLPADVLTPPSERNPAFRILLPVRTVRAAHVQALFVRDQLRDRHRQRLRLLRCHLGQVQLHLPLDLRAPAASARSG